MYCRCSNGRSEKLEKGIMISIQARERNANLFTAQERLSQVADHMSGGSSASKKGKSSLLEKHADDVSAAIQRCFALGVSKYADIPISSRAFN
jgi:hypothetical protein